MTIILFKCILLVMFNGVMEKSKKHLQQVYYTGPWRLPSWSWQTFKIIWAVWWRVNYGDREHTGYFEEEC